MHVILCHVKIKSFLNNACKTWFLVHQTQTRKYLYILTFLKTLRHYNPFLEKPKNDKILTYWVHQTIPEIIAMADELFEQDRYVEVYELLNRIRFTKEPQVLWRVARALYHLSCQEGIADRIRSEMVVEAQEVLRVALTIGEDSAEVHKWTAIILDKRHGMVNLECRVRNSDKVRDHLIRACELDPADFVSHYLLGKWCFEMCHLSWLQRWIAKYFVAAEPPTSTYQQAYRFLSRAEELRPRTFLPNMYLLGRTCLEIGQHYTAKYYLNLVTNLPPRDECEKCYVIKARRIMKKLDRFDLSKRVLFYGDGPFG